MLPRIMVASVRRAMPAARIVHLADETSTGIEGVDEVSRLPYDGVHLMPFRLQHLARLEPCDAVFLDTDVIVQKDLAAVFESEFDVLLTRRADIGLDPQGIDVAKAMPYNTGVMLSRPTGWPFWYNAWQLCETYSDEIRRWWGDQYAIKELVEVAPLQIKELPCEAYNYSPGFETEDVSARHVVHYKGDQRKVWMRRRAEIEFGFKTNGVDTPDQESAIEQPR